MSVVENPTNPWASRRKSVYLLVLVLVLTGTSFFIFWNFWYAAPTCFDGNKNGDELGVDCGGSCTLVCKADVIEPIIRWDPRMFEVTPGLWSVIVYVENPNIDTKATYLPYSFTIYDQNNSVLVKREGATILPQNKTVGIFEGGISVIDGLRPRRAVFEIEKNIVWEKTTKKEENISITHSSLLRMETAPRVEATVKNNGTEDLKNIELVAAIFDGSDNAIAASRTFIENLKQNQSSNIFFTWPKPFELGSKVCEKPSSIALLMDRSGSMTSISLDPPEPLNTAKQAAISFVKQLSLNDRVSVVSFATKSKNPIELPLTNDFVSAEAAINSINVERGSVQYTNIYEALHSAWQELVTPRAPDENSKIAVLLTDGVATNPRDPVGKTEEDDISFAEKAAITEASNLKRGGISIYTIGLGKNINESFLKNVASEEANYFFAPSADDLSNIYKNISSKICKEVPARIEITYKIFGDSI